MPKINNSDFDLNAYPEYTFFLGTATAKSYGDVDSFVQVASKDYKVKVGSMSSKDDGVSGTLTIGRL